MVVFDDLVAEQDALDVILGPLGEDLQSRPRGLTDFRILDPTGYCLRITDRAR